LLIHLTFVPRLMVMWAGLKLKPWIKTVLVGCLCALAVGCLCAPEPTATFGCRLTKQGDEPGDFTGCTSPITYPTLSEDTYTFEVRAEDEAANEDATPAERTFSVDTTSPRVTSLKATSVNSSGMPLRRDHSRGRLSSTMDRGPHQRGSGGRGGSGDLRGDDS
jgi:hypothetical protein